MDCPFSRVEFSDTVFRKLFGGGRLTASENVPSWFLPMARENAGEYCAPRVALDVLHRGVGPRSDLVPVSWDHRDGGPASSGRDDAARAGVGGGRAAPAVDGGRVRADVRERRTPVLCDPGEDVPEHLFSHQGCDAAIVRLERVGLSLDGVPEGGGMGSGPSHAKSGKGG